MYRAFGVAFRVFLTSAPMALLPTGAPAWAGTFDVKGAEVVEGESELAIGAAWQDGFPANSGFLRQSYETAYSYGLLPWLKAGAKIGFEQLDGERLQAGYAGVEAQAVLIDPAQAGFGLAWYTGVDFGLQPDAGEVMAFGPLVSFDLAEDLSVILNPLFEKAWSPATRGIDFTYAWQARATLNDNVGLGLEGYGAVPDVADAPSAAFQEHRLGPVLYLSHAGGSGSGAATTPGSTGSGNVELQLGVLFGLTDATPDTTARALLAITW